MAAPVSFCPKRYLWKSGVMSLLNSAVERQPEILRDPPPGVFFEAFGDSALLFRIYYWIELAGATDSRQVGSELRCRIEQATSSREAPGS